MRHFSGLQKHKMQHFLLPTILQEDAHQCVSFCKTLIQFVSLTIKLWRALDKRQTSSHGFYSEIRAISGSRFCRETKQTHEGFRKGGSSCGLGWGGGVSELWVFLLLTSDLLILLHRHTEHKDTTHTHTHTHAKWIYCVCSERERKERETLTFQLKLLEIRD